MTVMLLVMEYRPGSLFSVHGPLTQRSSFLTPDFCFEYVFSHPQFTTSSGQLFLRLLLPSLLLPSLWLPPLHLGLVHFPCYE